MIIRVFSLDNDKFEIFHETSNFFAGTNIQITRDVQTAHVITASRDDAMRAFIQDKSPRNGKFLIYTWEPFFSTISSRSIRVNGIDVVVLNVHNGGTFQGGIYHFFQHFFQFEAVRDLLAQNWLERKLRERPFSKKLAMVASYHAHRHGKYSWELCGLRARIALRFLAKDPQSIDLFGRGWPEFVPVRRNDRIQPDWRRNKCDILADYYFNLCFENSLVRNYVTEKLWDAILLGCLPIYFGSEWIDQVFPRQSYIDYRQFSGPDELYDFMAAMTRDEFISRYNRCRDVVAQVTPDSVDACRRQKKELVVNVLNHMLRSDQQMS